MEEYPNEEHIVKIPEIEYVTHNVKRIINQAAVLAEFLKNNFFIKQEFGSVKYIK